MTCITPSRCESTVRPRSQVGGLFCFSSHIHGQVVVKKKDWKSEPSDVRQNGLKPRAIVCSGKKPRRLSSQGSPRRWGRSRNLRVGRRVPVRKTKKEKIGMPFWLAILAEGSGSGRPRLWLSLWAYVWVWVWGAVHRLGHGDAAVGGWITVQTTHTLPTGFVMDNKMC